MAEGDQEAKSPEQLEAESKAADETLGKAARAVDDVRREETESGHEMADALNMMVGATRVDRMPAAQRNMVDAYTKAVGARQAATWARKAIAYGLTLAGTAMLVAGVAGVGNAAPAAAPAPSAGTTTAAPSGSAAANKPPVVGPIVANLIPTNTFYNVTATDPEGDKLTYVWTKSNPCGPFTFQDGTAVWAHPHPPCPNEEFHPGTITVVITDGHGNTVTRTYDGGSQTGTGTVPSSPPTGSPTPFPTTTTRDASAQPSLPPTTGNTGGPNVPLVAGGLLLGGAGAGLITQERKKKKTCDDERAEEARTARELRRAKDAFDDINQTRNAMNYADQRARDADRAASAAANGVATGGVSGEPMHFIGPKAGAAQAAKDAAQGAHDEAGWRHRDFDGKGGQAAWQRAKDALDAATKAHDAAAAALAACLEEIAPPAPPPPPPPPPPPTTGGTTAGPTGGTTVKPPCVQGTKRNEQSRTEKMELDDLSTAKVLLDSEYPGIDRIDAESLMDWAEFFKNGFFKGKNIKSFIDGPVEGVLDVADFPDFLTYYDKMGDEVLKALRRMIRVAETKHKIGTYSLEFRRRQYTMTCTTWEECDGNAYMAQRAFTVTLDNATRHTTSQIDVQDPSEVEGALTRLFNELKFRNQREEAKAKRFEEGCK